MGGGFGAKFGPRIEGVAAAKLAREAGAPVKLFLDRKEEQTAAGNRPSSIQKIKAGATKDGKLKALHLVVHGTGGTNGGTGPPGPAKNIYACPNLKVEEYDVFTNAGPSAAFRAPGHPQGAFALEATMDELARELGMDPLEFRDEERSLRGPAGGVPHRRGEDRLEGPRRRRKTNDPAILPRRRLRSRGLVQHRRPGAPRHRPRSTGTARPKSSTAAQDLGTGARTIIAIVAAEELGLPLEKVSVRDRRHSPAVRADVGRLDDDPLYRADDPARRLSGQARSRRAIAGEWKVPAESVSVGTAGF